MKRLIFAAILGLALLVPGIASADGPALTGKFHTRFKQLVRVHLIPATKTRRTWIFRDVIAHGRPVKQLLFELGSGGYTRFNLRQRNATTWVSEPHKGNGPWCPRLDRYVGTGRDSVSTHITTTAVIDGVERATEIEAYYRATLTGSCGPGPALVAKETRRYRGSLVES
jgi:hypothetical protein